MGKELNIISQIKVNCAYVGRKGIKTDGGTDPLIYNVSSRRGVIAQFHPPAASISRKILPVTIALEFSDGSSPLCIYNKSNEM